MKKQTFLAAVLLIFFLAAPPLMAADQFYVGIKGGLIGHFSGLIFSSRHTHLLAER